LERTSSFLLDFFTHTMPKLNTIITLGELICEQNITFYSI
jgi:hypothetical protein